MSHLSIPSLTPPRDMLNCSTFGWSLDSTHKLSTRIHIFHARRACRLAQQVMMLKALSLLVHDLPYARIPSTTPKRSSTKSSHPSPQKKGTEQALLEELFIRRKRLPFFESSFEHGFLSCSTSPGACCRCHETHLAHHHFAHGQAPTRQYHAGCYRYSGSRIFRHQTSFRIKRRIALIILALSDLLTSKR